MKQIINRTLSLFGLELRRIARKPGSPHRPIGDVRMFLEDIRARGFEPRGVIDVGANRGRWTSMLLSVFPDSNVIMIEPQEEMRPLLDQLCRENPKLEFIQAGAGREPGELVQTIWEDLAGSSFFPEISEEKIREGKQRMTPITTIDDILKERRSFFPDLVKLDVQGFELEALRGATSLFRRTEVFILETSLYRFHQDMPVTVECIQFMAEKGYDLYDVTESLRRPFDGALGQVDLAFARASGILRASNRWDVEQGAPADGEKPRR